MKRLTSPAGVAAILFLLVIAATVHFAAMRFAAEMSAQDSRFRFERWATGKAKPQAGEVSAAVASLRAALDYEPRNPHLHSDIGRILYWSVRSDSRMVDAESRAVRQAALESFRQAAPLRPASGYIWANIALKRYMLGHVDSEFTHALEQTLRWAPWQPQMQLTGIQLGLATWQELEPATQQRVAEAIRRQVEWKMVDQKPALISLLRGYGRMELGCPWGGKALACPGS